MKGNENETAPEYSCGYFLSEMLSGLSEGSEGSEKDDLSGMLESTSSDWSSQMLQMWKAHRNRRILQGLSEAQTRVRTGKRYFCL